MQEREQTHETKFAKSSNGVLQENTVEALRATEMGSKTGILYQKAETLRLLRKQGPPHDSDDLQRLRKSEIL